MLDLDETLIHSHHDGVVRPTVKPGTPPDFILKVSEALLYSANIFRVILGGGNCGPIATSLILCTLHQWPGDHRPPPSEVLCAQAAPCGFLPLSGGFFSSENSTSQVKGLSVQYKDLSLRYPSGLSLSCSLPAWKYMAPPLQTSWTATRAC